MIALLYAASIQAASLADSATRSDSLACLTRAPVRESAEERCRTERANVIALQHKLLRFRNDVRLLNVITRKQHDWPFYVSKIKLS
jgi:hypothetical protein